MGPQLIALALLAASCTECENDAYQASYNTTAACTGNIFGTVDPKVFCPCLTKANMPAPDCGAPGMPANMTYASLCADACSSYGTCKGSAWRICAKCENDAYQASYNTTAACTGNIFGTVDPKVFCPCLTKANMPAPDCGAPGMPANMTYASLCADACSSYGTCNGHFEDAVSAFRLTLLGLAEAKQSRG